MKSFSQRQELKPIVSMIQVDSMNEELRNRLWNVLDYCYWAQGDSQYNMESSSNQGLKQLSVSIWHHYFRKPIDNIPFYWGGILSEIRNYYYECEWNEVYDFIEFIAVYYPDEGKNKGFIEGCNSVLETDLSGFRFIDGIIAPITEEVEIQEIKEALDSSEIFKPVTVHLKTALQLFSDRESPDYRNSIKESISAVEAMCRLISGSNATLGKALDKIQKQGKVKIHESLEGSLDKLYGYTSNEGGIRHSLLDAPNLDPEDAKFMLISCSAFVNYLKVKASKADISFT